MKKIFNIIVVILFLYGCTTNMDNLQNRGGVFYKEGTNNKFTGKFIKKESWAFNKNAHISKGYCKDGLLEGKYEEWIKKTKIYDATYKNGKLEGKVTYWSVDGSLDKEENYFNGLLNGSLVEYYNNGNKKLEEYYKNGKRNGISQGWNYESGRKEYEINYNDDHQVGHYLRWDYNGNKEEEGVSINDFDYEWKITYYKNGNKASEINYISKINKEWFENGKLSTDGYIDNRGRYIANIYNEEGKLINIYEPAHGPF